MRSVFLTQSSKQLSKPSTRTNEVIWSLRGEGDFMPKTVIPDERAVFLNVPFDTSYEPLFIALIASIVSVGRIPRSVLELSDSGEGRLQRILKQMESCRVSLHDLSRVGQPARFNMPFELGLAYALRAYRGASKRYVFVLMERIPFRLTRTLSDLAGHDPQIHGGRPIGAITAVLDSIGSSYNYPTPDDVYLTWRRLRRASRSLKSQYRTQTIYSRRMFKSLVAAASQLAADDGLIGH
jgi:hypothetical protein